MDTIFSIFLNVIYEEVATSRILLIQVFKKYRRKNRKTPVSEYIIFNEATGLSLKTLLKRDSDTGNFLLILRNF